MIDPAPPVVARIDALLARGSTPHRRLRHAPVHTSEEAAIARGESMEIGGKSLVMKVGPERFAVFALSAARRSHGSRIRKFLGVPRLRFATRDELMALTGLRPGCVPPFGPPVFENLSLYVDESIAHNQRIAFNPGDHRVSIIMAVDDYLELARPAAVFAFSRP